MQVVNIILKTASGLVFLMASGVDADSISWQMNGAFAKSNASPSSSGLTVLYTAKEPSGAQFPYTKTNGNETVPVVQVLLINQKTGYKRLLQSDFSMIGQTCSCYWIAAADQFAADPTMKSSDSYRIQFLNEAGAINYVSGEFGLVQGSSWNATTSAPPKTSTSKPPPATSTKNTIPTNPPPPPPPSGGITADAATNLPVVFSAAIGFLVALLV